MSVGTNISQENMFGNKKNDRHVGKNKTRKKGIIKKYIFIYAQIQNGVPV